MSGYISTKEVSKILNVSGQTILNRTKKLKLRPKLVNKKNYYSEEQIEKLNNYNYIPNIYKLKKYSSAKINIIDFFLINPHNSVKEIADKMDLKEMQVTTTINEYLQNNRTIIVASKL